MHICMASSGSDPILPERRGAVESYVWGLSKQLCKRENYVTVFGAGKGKKENGNLRIRTCTYNEQTFSPFKKLLGHTPIYPPNILFNKFLFKEILHLHKVFPIDILHIHNIYSGTVASFCKLVLNILVVCSIHNEIRFTLPIQTCDKILPVSRYLERFLLENKRVNPKKVETLPVAVDPSTYTPYKTASQAKKELNLHNNRVILFVGRKCPEKGPQVLVSALPRILQHHPNALAVLIGPDYFFGSRSTSYSKHLMSLANDLNVGQHILLKSFVSEEDLIRYYGAADLVVCPSIWQEPLGIVILEALACEKPVVASNIGGIPEILSDNVSGLLVHPNDSSTLADAVIQLLNSKELSLQLGVKGREMVQKKFSFEVVAKQCIGIYEKLFKLAS